MDPLSTLIERFDYRDINGRAAFCKLELLRAPEGRTVVVATQLGGNTGMSITNAAELVAAAVCQHFNIDPIKLVWIERYDADSYAGHDHEVTFDLVTFLQISATPPFRFARPCWRQVTEADWQALGLPSRETPAVPTFFTRSTGDAMPTELFPLGQCVITAHAHDVLHSGDVQESLQRHARGDWGDLNVSDQRENALALTQGLRLFSRYRDRWGQKFYIITEASREVTTVLLPEDY